MRVCVSLCQLCRPPLQFPRVIARRGVQVALIVYLLDLSTLVPSLVARGCPVLLAVLVLLVCIIAVLEYLFMPLTSMLLHSWLAQPRANVCAITRAFRVCVCVLV